MPFLGTFMSPCPVKMVAGNPVAVVNLTVSAFLENDLPDPSVNGQARITSSAPDFGQLVGVYDASGILLPGNIVTLQGGTFAGMAAVKPLKAGRPGGNFVDLALDANMVDGSFGGGGRPCRFILPVITPTDTDWVEFSDKGQVLWSGVRREPLDLRLRTKKKGLLFPSFTGGS